MTWNLRLVNMTSEEFPDEDYIEVREVYYDQMGKPMGHCVATMGGQDKEEIKTYLKWAMEALDKPALTFGE
jgi:tetrahydromethanopterin S-methyltransferase subunit H